MASVTAEATTTHRLPAILRQSRPALPCLPDRHRSPVSGRVHAGKKTVARQNDRMSSPYDTGRFAGVSGLDQVATHADVVTVVEQMLTDLRAHPEAWENHTLERFLDALAASLGAKKPPAQPTWKLLAETLVMASGYE
jgi:hypothetical protein